MIKLTMEDLMIIEKYESILKWNIDDYRKLNDKSQAQSFIRYIDSEEEGGVWFFNESKDYRSKSYYAKEAIEYIINIIVSERSRFASLCTN